MGNAEYMGNPSSVAARRRSPRRRKQFRGSMVKGVFSFVLVIAFAALATALPQRIGGDKFCECVDPFHGTRNAFRGDSDNLCGDNGPGFCYVDCEADCRDIQPTASSSRCQSTEACKVEHGFRLLSVNNRQQ